MAAAPDRSPSMVPDPVSGARARFASAAAAVDCQRGAAAEIGGGDGRGDAGPLLVAIDRQRGAIVDGHGTEVDDRRIDGGVGVHRVGGR